MKKYFSIIIISVSFIFILVNAQNAKAAEANAETQAQAEAPDCIPGTYQITGDHSQLGKYFGQLVIKEDLSVQRKITFTTPVVTSQINSLRSDSYTQDILEQLWEGACKKEGLEFIVKTSHTLSHFDGFTASKEDFQFQTVLVQDFSQNPTSTDWKLKLDGNYHETYQKQSEATQNIFSPNQITIENSTGHTKGLIATLAKHLGVNQLLKYYRSLDAFKESREKKEFKEAQQYTITDFNDFEFYKTHPQFLRVRNLSLNPLSLAEARQRRLAFVPSMHEKAQFKQFQTDTLTFNEADILEQAQINEKAQKIGSIADGDSTLWTAMYLWSQYTRYQVTKEESAYQNFKRAVNGLLNLMKISNDPKLFARFIIKSLPNEILDPALRQGTGEFANLKWHPRTNNDMSKGMLIGFTLAYMGLEKRDESLRAEVATYAKRLLDVKAISSSSFNHGMAYGINALWNHDLESAKKFSLSINNLVNVISDKLHISSGFYVGGSEDASGIHLSTISSTIQLLLARELEKSNEFTQLKREFGFVRKAATKNLLESVKRLPEAHHDYINIFAYALTRDENIKAIAQKSVGILNEVPKKALFEAMHVELTLQPDWCFSAWPRYAWNNIKAPFIINKKGVREDVSMFQGAYSYPLFESYSISSTYLWKDGSYSRWHDKPKGVVSFSADYLLFYWLARSSGLISAQD